MKKIAGLFFCVCILITALPAQADATSFLKKLFGWGEEPAAAVPQPGTAAVAPLKHLQEFTQDSMLYTRSHFDKNPVTYEIRIPKNWELIGHGTSRISSLDGPLLRNLDVYRGRIIVGSDRPYLRVQAMKLEHEMLIEHWLQNYIYKNGYAQEGEVEAISEYQGKAHFIHLENGISYKSIIKAFITGNRLIAARFDMPVAGGDEKLYEYGIHMIDSFNIKDFTADVIEDAKDFSFQGRLRFSYPQSWEIKNSVMLNPNEKSVELQNLQDGEVLKGLIRFVSYRKNPGQSAGDLVRDFNADLRADHNMRIVKLLGSSPLLIGLNYDTAVTERYTAGLNGTIHDNYEIWVTILEGQDWLNLIYLLTPDQSQDYYEWARNTRSYDLVIHSIN